MVGPRPSFDVDATPVVAGAGAQFAVQIAPMLRLDPTPRVLVAGVVAGVVAGALSGRYGNAMNNGLAAAAVAGVIACLVVAAYGSYVSWRVGFGLDSRLAGWWGFHAAMMLALLVPIQVVEGAVAAALTADVRERVSARAV
jgi:hypothetical protein